MNTRNQEISASMDEREAALRVAQRRLRLSSHHALWLEAVDYRNDPLDQALVDRVLRIVHDGIEWQIRHPEADRLSSAVPCALMGGGSYAAGVKDAIRLAKLAAGAMPASGLHPTRHIFASAALEALAVEAEALLPSAKAGG